MILPLGHGTSALMTQLSVNVNKLATLRNSRGKNTPNLLEFSEKILTLGVFGLTVHPRPDGRHIRKNDVLELKELIQRWQKKSLNIEFNIEGYPSEDFMQLIEAVKPEQCTLVPDPPEALTSNAGWDLVKNFKQLYEVTHRLGRTSRVSLFVEPSQFSKEQAEALKNINPHRIELYTEAYADAFGHNNCQEVLESYKATAMVAKDLGIGVNAGHDLNQENLGLLIKTIPWIAEVSIGHALFCESLEQGLSTTIRRYQAILASPL